MGAGDFVVRGGYARSFSRPAIGDFTKVFNTNPGVRLSQQPQPRTRSWRTTDRSGVLTVSNPAVSTQLPFPSSPTYPFAPTSITNSIAGFDPNIQVPYADTWQAGIARSLGKNMALEVRYVGTPGLQGLGQLQLQRADIATNGFLKEFQAAQANLQANIANGRGNTFAFTGAPGTRPLPTFLGFFQGPNASNASNPATYTSTNFTNATFSAFLAANNPNPFGSRVDEHDERLHRQRRRSARTVSRREFRRTSSSANPD